MEGLGCAELRVVLHLGLNMGSGGQGELPQDLVSVLPSDPYEQLDVARRITAMAVATSMSKLESETGKLRQKLTEKEQVIHGLQGRVLEAEAALQVLNAKLSQSEAEQTKLVDEKNSLALQVKGLLRDVAKLETFKRTLMHSLEQEEDDNLAPNSAIWKASQAESAVVKAQNFEDHGRYAKTSSRPDPPKYQGDLDAVSDGRTTPPKSRNGRTVPKQIVGGSTTLRPSSQLIPIGSRLPKNVDSPLNSMIQLPSSQPTSGASSPPSHGSGQSRSTRLDGKEFFRQARSRLSYEQFSSFLANIKELNAHRQTREDTLGQAERIFGPENRDLSIAFEAILSRHLPS